ncbi:helix-turn-helix domain-containing protein [Arundinibacter roseus]|uniref:XRE family transcriptional regulator n=1 Tax=Arundinibacter roseus TaxID=2070510 RepID=A0A4R4JZ74_9BACT|nr:helix-turn-helix transcriptional regulator [Arundinibacter roseus]TDB60063.1 XRE family transcriptional regulator [Arundinibacter roseus]
MEKTVNHRINELISSLNKNHKTFAESIGKSPTVIYNTVNGRNKPSFDVLEAICEIYPQVNAGWLLKGEGEMFASSSKSNLIDQSPDNYLQDHIKRLEDNFSKLANQLEKKDEQLEKKDEQIEHLHEMLKIALGKSEGVSTEPVCDPKFSSKKGAKTPFFGTPSHKFGYTPCTLMVAGSF